MRVRDLTASETAYLHGEAFARPSPFHDTIALPAGPAKVRLDELARAILAAAFLEAERAGAIVLAREKQARMFGLVQADRMLAQPGILDVRFPDGTLEARIAHLVRANVRDPRKIVQTLLAAKDTRPAALVVREVQAPLVRDGIVEARRERRLGLFPVTTHALTDAGRALRERSAPEPVKELLASWSSGRPDDWQVLVDSLDAGVASRKHKEGF